ncbi:MAG: alpha-amylase family glycosyl hydrolase, partial [Myxococcota bacterium]
MSALLWSWLFVSGVRAQPIQSVYLIMVDRYANGDSDNDEDADINDPTAFHGGDLRGIIDHIDHIEAMGVQTVWLTPISKMRTEPIGTHGAFHGY